MIDFTNKEKNYIRFILSNEPYLRPVFDNVYKIPQRAREIDKNIFIVWHTIKKRYELHTIDCFILNEDYNFTTHQAEFRFDSLDERALQYICDNSIKINGNKIIDEINDSEEEYEKLKEEYSELYSQRVLGKMHEIASGKHNYL